MSQVLWKCPNGCSSVHGPSRPRKNDVRRYCLTCSARTGRLVERTSPTLDLRRSMKSERRKLKRQRSDERHVANETLRFTIDGVDLRAELDKLWASRAVRELRAKTPHLTKPTMRIRRVSRRPRSRVGVAWPWESRIQITNYPGIDRHDAIETLAHEVAHCLTPGDHHGVAWKTVYRNLCSEIYGVRPKVDVIWHSEVSKALRERARLS